MPLICSHALLTIFAARATSVQDGFLQERNTMRDLTKEPGLITELPLMCPSGELGSITIVPAFPLEKEPIATRAWTLQEHLLSPRVLEFGTRQTVRYCASSQNKASFSDG